MLQKLQKKIKEFFEEKGQGVVEYALILGFVAILAVALFQANGLKSKVDGNISAVGGELGAMSDAITGATATIKVST